MSTAASLQTLPIEVLSAILALLSLHDRISVRFSLLYPQLFPPSS